MWSIRNCLIDLVLAFKLIPQKIIRPRRHKVFTISSQSFLDKEHFQTLKFSLDTQP